MLDACQSVVRPEVLESFNCQDRRRRGLKLKLGVSENWYASVEERVSVGDKDVWDRRA